MPNSGATGGTAPSSGPQGRRLAAHREEILEIARSHRACNVRIFGSVATGTDTAASDIDLLVDLVNDQTLLTLAGLADDLSRAVGVKVDVATVDLLREGVREEALRTAIRL